MIAHALTAVRLILAAPVAVAFAQPSFLDPGLLFVVIAVAIATDYGDGRVARSRGTASPRGQLFDHATDCVFVTAGLTGAAAAGAVTPVLPPLIVVAFGQYGLDSYVRHRRIHLRMSRIGRWNGIFYFAPLVVLSASRLAFFGDGAPFLMEAVRLLGYLLAASTVVSILDRATAR